jgi:hypothetical protein
VNNAKCPLDKSSKNNLLYLLSIRHEVEHKMADCIDNFVSAKFQACCLNFNDFLTSHFDKKFDLANYQALSLQFSGISANQKEILSQKNLPKNIRTVTTAFEKKLSDDEYNDRRYSYRVFLIQKTSNHKGTADEVTEFIKPGSDKEVEINRILIKETEKPKFKPKKIIQLMHKEGYKKFNMHHHASLWKKLDAQNPGKGYGIKLDDANWYWYESWISIVREHCQNNKKIYS